MTIKDTIALSWRNIRSNRLRTGLTVAIIALGICALIWFLTALKAASYSLNSTFSTMGANAFSVRFKERKIRIGDGGPNREAKAEKKSSLKEKKSNIGKVITYEQAKQFKEQYPFPAKVSLAIRGGGNLVVNTDRKKTNPDINVLGSDENYLELNGYTINAGRNFTPTEVETGRNICMLGSAVASKLFPDNPLKAIDKVVKVDHIPYRVIAVLNDKGSSSFFNTGKIVLTSYNNIRRLFANNNASFSIGVMVTDNKQMNVAVGEAKGTFRPIRKLDIVLLKRLKII
jgi:putative ABC transport system permease protein